MGIGYYQAMYNHVFVAGTFDGMHRGHEVILRRAFIEGEHVTIGVTSDAFIKKFKFAQLDKLAKYSKRKKDLETWLRVHEKEAMIVSINDPYEPAASMADLDALIVTRENRNTGERINRLRQGSTLPCLALIEVPMVSGEDGRPISSTRLRNGEIDRNGRLIMPDSMRAELARPLGIVLSGSRIGEAIKNHRENLIVTVGDIATETLVKHGTIPSFSIIDQKVNRNAHDTLAHLPDTLLRNSIKVKSGPGYISQEAIKAITTWVKKPTTTLLVVDGEEDLLALPAIIHAPRGSILYYGQPNKGLACVIVTNEKKHEALALLARFS